ncbi:MAG: DNA methyltransferase [Desulfobia sp.]
MNKQSGQNELFQDQSTTEDQGPVECLGMTFKNDEERRECFLDKLQEKLKDPEFRKTEGFPFGEDEDILALSDPPYYTACPNPFLEDFVSYHGKPYDPETDNYRREPFTADVSEGKNDPIYNAHSYHTKVPHKAIMRYILHYTEPGDLVFDGFCGTGMTGVAAQLCGDQKTVESLGYKVDAKGDVYQQGTAEKGETSRQHFSRLGTRKAVLNDLSPAATFIAYNYNTPVDVQEFEKEAERILREVEEECGWMYSTLIEAGDNEAQVKSWAEKLGACRTADEVRTLLAPRSSGLSSGAGWGRINYTVWSDVYTCPECTSEVIFWEAAVDKKAGKVKSEFPCLHCRSQISKRKMDRAWVTRFDRAINQTIRQAKQVPVLINYSVGRKRYEKRPDAFDLALITKIEQLDIPYWFPANTIPKGDKTGEPFRIGITHVHHYYPKRNLWMLGTLKKHLDRKTKLIFQSIVSTLCSRLVRYNMGHRGNGPLSGTLYVSSLIAETRPSWVFSGKVKAFSNAFAVSSYSYIDTQTLSNIPSIKENTLDYIFTDPPFGGNLMYSELNFLWEAWLQVFTNNKSEAIENKVQGKGLPEYQHLMTKCFEEYYRVLKPGRWMTVEFHNSKNSVWNSIQEGLQTAGFVVADVRTLDKAQGSFNQVTQAGSVKQDLIISAYKPNGGLEHRFQLTAGTEDGVWDFVRTHLKQLPVFVSKNGQAEVIAERQNYLLFDRMVAFHVQRGETIPISAADFYAGLEQRFSLCDGMYFLPDQVDEYNKKRKTVKEVRQLQLYVSDEASAIQWLKQQLTSKPQTAGDLKPQFMQEISGWQKNEKMLELDELLDQNFLRYDGKGEVPSQIHSYLSSNFKELRNLEKDDPALIAKARDRWYVPDPSKAAERERLREKALLREFEQYRQRSRKFKNNERFRLEAVRAGFKKAWQERDYSTIVSVAQKIPEKILQEDSKLLMWYDQAFTRMGGD